MKYFKYLSLPIVLLIIGLTASCERDDICAESTATTPSLIVDVFNEENKENRKNVLKMVIIDDDAELIPNSKSILPGYNFIASTNNLILPLRTDQDTTTYKLIKNATISDNATPMDPSDDKIEGNIDVITISYTREEVYVSRACGFKTIFKNVIFTRVIDSDNWIISKQNATDNQSVEDEATAHFNIFH